MQLKRVAEAKLPTPWGDFLMVGFEELATGQDHVALVYGDISGQTPFCPASTQSVLPAMRCSACAVIVVSSWKPPCLILQKKAAVCCFITVRKVVILVC